MGEDKRPLLTNRLKLFMATMILANVAGNMWKPLLPLYLQELGADVGQIGLFFTLGTVAPLFFQVFGGWLSDAIGCLQAIAIGSVAGVVGYAVYTLAPSLQWLLIATATGAMASSFVAPSYMAFIVEESTEETRGRVYGLSSTLFQIVGIVGPPIGGYLSQYLGFRPMFVIARVLYTSATEIRLGWSLDAAASSSACHDSPNLVRRQAVSGIYGWAVEDYFPGDAQTQHLAQPRCCSAIAGTTVLSHDG
jgi:MFS family permease